MLFSYIIITTTHCRGRGNGYPKKSLSDLCFRRHPKANWILQSLIVNFRFHLDEFPEPLCSRQKTKRFEMQFKEKYLK